MNIGKKITILKEVAGFNNYQEFGRFVDLNGDWILDQSKKQEITTVDVTRLIKICNKFNVTLDWLLSDGEEYAPATQYQEDDISTMLSQIQDQMRVDKKFEGTPLTDETAKLAQDGIEVVKKLIRQNL